MRHTYIKNIERLTVKRKKYCTNAILKINKTNEKKIQPKHCCGDINI